MSSQSQNVGAINYNVVPINKFIVSTTHILVQNHAPSHNSKSPRKTWLARRGFRAEVSSRIILANKNGGVKTAPPNSPIIYLKRLSIFLRENERKPSIFSANQLKSLSHVIQQHRLQYNPYPLCNYYKLDPKLLTKGQLCSTCNATMIYLNHKSRYCKWCKEKEPNNYGQSIQDWLMLIDTSISNRECRDFLQINDRREAHYALKSLNLIKEGKSVLPDTPGQMESPLQFGREGMPRHPF